MKVALLGDVHGNHLALAAVLNAARKHDVERLLLTGDLVGYYYWPREVLGLLETWDTEIVRGNHEEMLAEARKKPAFLEKAVRRYGSGLRVAIETLSPEQLEWLETLPHPKDLVIDGRKILLCHGSPWDLDQYIYPDEKEAVLAECAKSGHDWVVLGHTHHPMNRTCGATTIVNPGSVGQPRNRRPEAHWALLDTRTGQVEQFSEMYDATLAIQQARQRDPHIPYLWNVLSRK